MRQALMELKEPTFSKGIPMITRSQIVPERVNGRGGSRVSWLSGSAKDTLGMKR